MTRPSLLLASKSEPRADKSAVDELSAVQERSAKASSGSGQHEYRYVNSCMPLLAPDTQAPSAKGECAWAELLSSQGVHVLHW